MGFDMSDLERAERRKWLTRTKKEDPEKAKLFCSECTQYLGAAKECDCEQKNLRRKNEQQQADH